MAFVRGVLCRTFSDEPWRCLAPALLGIFLLEEITGVSSDIASQQIIEIVGMRIEAVLEIREGDVGIVWQCIELHYASATVT